MERDAEIEAMMNEIRNTSAKKRESLGRAINRLNGKVLDKELGYNIIKYGRSESIKTEISVGDLVLISKNNPFKSDLQGLVTEIGNKFIKVAVDKVPKWSLNNVRIDLYANDITYRRMIDNLKKLKPKGRRTIELLLGHEKSYNFQDKLSEEEYNSYLESLDLNFYDNELNESQKLAIKNSIISNDFFLIHGPFGTGKTRTIVELIKQEMKLNKEILVCSESNTAVDNILNYLIKEEKIDLDKVLRLGHPERVSKENKKLTLAYKVEKHKSNKKIKKILEDIEELIDEQDKFTKPSPKYKRGYSNEDIKRLARTNKPYRGLNPKLLKSMKSWIMINEEIDLLYTNIYEIEDKIISEIIENSQVIVSTNSSASLEYIEDIYFDITIIDEASQATIPSVLIPISKSKKFILAGDHKQLPPTVLNDRADELSITLFETLIAMFPEKSKLLDTQYRMNEKLMEFPNKKFYKGKIKAFRNDYKFDDEIILSKDYEVKIDLENHLNNYDILFLDTKSTKYRSEKRLKDSKSKQNPFEAYVLSKIAIDLIENGYTVKKIGIISPYKDQVDCIKNTVNKGFNENYVFDEKYNCENKEKISILEDLEVKTVDGFQGREKEIIMISFVRSNNAGKIGFLLDLRRLNVSLTRVKRKLIVVGDSSTLNKHPLYAEWIDFCKKNGFYVKINNNNF